MGSSVNPLRKNIIYCCLTIGVLCLIASAGIYLWGSVNSVKKALNQHQAVVVDLVEGGVVAGSFYENSKQHLQLDQVYQLPQNAGKSMHTAPRIAILVQDLGVDNKTTGYALELPNTVALGFSPYTNDLQNLLRFLSAHKVEVMLNLPLQDVDHPANDPGPGALLVTHDWATNLEKLNSLFSFGEILGFYTSESEAFSSSPQMPDLLRQLQHRGKVLLDGRGNPTDSLRELSAEVGATFIKLDVKITPYHSDQEVLEKLDLALHQARQHGLATTSIAASVSNLVVLKKWLSTLEEKNVSIVRFSSLFPQGDIADTLEELGVEDPAHNSSEDPAIAHGMEGERGDKQSIDDSHKLDLKGDDR